MRTLTDGIAATADPAERHSKRQHPVLNINSLNPWKLKRPRPMIPAKAV